MTVKELIQYALDNQIDLDKELKIIKHGLAKNISAIYREPQGSRRNAYIELGIKIKEKN